MAVIAKGYLSNPDIAKGGIEKMLEKLAGSWYDRNEIESVTPDDMMEALNNLTEAGVDLKLD